jgi:hypothetical protein
MCVFIILGFISFPSAQTLTTLIFRENKISEIPAEIGELTQLTALDLSHNNLQGLPEGTPCIVCMYFVYRDHSGKMFVCVCDMGGRERRIMGGREEGESESE